MSRRNKSNKPDTAFPRDSEADPQPSCAPESYVTTSDDVVIVPDSVMPKQRRARDSKYPWDTLGLSSTQGPGGPLVGPMLKIKGTTRTIGSQAWHAGRVRGKKFSVRDLGDGYVGVWRTA